MKSLSVSRIIALIILAAAENEKRFSEAKQVIDRYKMENGEFSEDETGNELIKGIEDVQEKQIRYERNAKGEGYLIRSAGGDGVFDSKDDQTSVGDFDLDAERESDTKREQERWSANDYHPRDCAITK